jgi:hypothetical protein
MSRFRLLRKNNLPSLLALALAAGLLAACSSASITDMIPTAAGGLPANAPARPATEEYPAVGAMPQRREALPLTDEEVKRAQAELTTLRQQQEERTGTAAKPATPAKKDAAAAKPAKKTKDAKPPAELTAKEPAK